MTQMLVACGLLVGIIGLLWALVLSVVHDNRRAHDKKAPAS